MKNYNEIETFDEKNTPEVYSFSEIEHQKQLAGENYVFNSENNSLQTGLDVNDAQNGIEDNDVYSSQYIETNEDNDRKEDKSNRFSSSSSTSSSSAAASSGGGVLATIAATATAAVVAVVGGGIVMNETYKKPAICEFQEVAAYENNVDFLLYLGNLEIEEPINDQEGEPTNCVIEISSPLLHYSDEMDAGHLGYISGEFHNLEYDTDYYLNVYYPTLLGADREYLLPEGYLIRTPSREDPGPGPGPGPDPEPVLPERIILSSTQLYMLVGDTYQFEVEVLPLNTTDKTITWRAEDPEVVSIENGFLTALSAGRTSVYAICGDVGAVCTVSVSQPDVPTTSIELNKHELTLESGSIENLIATVTPSDSTDIISWSSSNYNVASVNGYGEVYAVSSGEATITVTSGDYSDTCIVTVIPKIVHVESVTITDANGTPLSEYELNLGYYLRLSYLLLPGNASDQSVQWSSSNPDVVDITEVRTYDAMVRAYDTGTAIIRATSTSDPEVYSEVTITVTGDTIYTQGISFSEEYYSIPEVGQSVDVTVTVEPSKSTEKVYFYIEDETIASISYMENKCTVTGLKAGYTTLTAVSGDASAEVEIEVQGDIEVEEMSFRVESAQAPLDVYIPSGKTSLNLFNALYVQPENARIEDISFTSSDDSIATVDEDGTLHGLQLGIVTITATYNGTSSTLSASIEIEIIVPITSIEIDETEYYIYVDDILELNLTILPENATYPDNLTYQTFGDDCIEIVDGKIKGASVGTGYVSIYSDYANIQLTIIVQEPGVTSY